jgi:hypothetical protein
MRQVRRRRPGRPPLPEGTVTMSMRLAPRDLAAIDQLAAQWGCSRSDAIRRCVRERYVHGGSTERGQG